MMLSKLGVKLKCIDFFTFYLCAACVCVCDVCAHVCVPWPEKELGVLLYYPPHYSLE